MAALAEQKYIGTKDTVLENANSNANGIWIKAMTDSERTVHSFVVCVDNHGYEVSLEKHKIYRALPDQAAALDEDLRIVDESGEDYLYPSARFVSIAVPAEVERSLAASGE